MNILKNYSQKSLTIATLSGFVIAIVVLVFKCLLASFQNEDQAMIYAIIQTPPGSTLEN